MNVQFVSCCSEGEGHVFWVMASHSLITKFRVTCFIVVLYSFFNCADAEPDLAVHLVIRMSKFKPFFFEPTEETNKSAYQTEFFKIFLFEFTQS